MRCRQGTRRDQPLGAVRRDQELQGLIARHVIDHNGNAWNDTGNGDVRMPKQVDRNNLVKSDFIF